MPPVTLTISQKGLWVQPPASSRNSFSSISQTACPAFWLVGSPLYTATDSFYGTNELAM